jgi:hypothetical protein
MVRLSSALGPTVKQSVMTGVRGRRGCSLQGDQEAKRETGEIDVLQRLSLLKACPKELTSFH